MPKSFKRQSSTLVVLHCSFDSGEVFELVTVPEPCSCRSGSFSYFHLCLTWSLPTKILYGVNSRRNQLQWMINVSLVLVFFGLSGLVRQCTHNTGWRLVPTPLSHKVWTTIRFVRERNRSEIIFLRVNRRPIRYELHADPKAIRYSVNTASENALVCLIWYFFFLK